MFELMFSNLNNTGASNAASTFRMPTSATPSLFNYPSLFNFGFNPLPNNMFMPGLFNFNTPVETIKSKDYTGQFNLFENSQSVANTKIEKKDFNNVSFASFRKSKSLLENKGLLSLNNSAYNAQAGKKLTEIALGDKAGRSKGQCATYVKNAIQNAGLGGYVQGDAYKCADILSQNNNFKEINISGEKLSELPAGCVVVYNKGDAGYSAKAGHIEITTGNGTAVSDFLNNSIRPSDDARVFIPV